MTQCDPLGNVRVSLAGIRRQSGIWRQEPGERRDTCDEDEAVTSQAGLNQRYKRGNLRENFVTSCDQVGGEDELLHNTWETQTDGHPAMYLDNILIHFHGIVDNFHTFGHQLMLQVNA